MTNIRPDRPLVPMRPWLTGFLHLLSAGLVGAPPRPDLASARVSRPAGHARPVRRVAGGAGDGKRSDQRGVAPGVSQGEGGWAPSAPRFEGEWRSRGRGPLASPWAGG